jgi:drug/metabolite transporter (DMT)-like permease
MLSGSGNGLKSFNANGFLVILATMCYGLNLNYIKTYLSKVNAITISSYSLVIILPLTSLILFYDGAFIKAINSNPATLTPLYYLLILGIVGTALALVLFNRLVQLKEPVFASSVTYLIPIVAIIWGIIDGENLLSTHYFGLIIIISGVYLANKKRAK